MRMRTTFGILCLAVASLTAVPGCLIHSSTRTSYSGRYVSPETLDRIETGVTTREEVIALIGEPTSKRKDEDGAETWKWSYRKAKTSSGSVFLLFSSRNQSESDGATLVQFREGIVIRRWQE